MSLIAHKRKSISVSLCCCILMTDMDFYSYKNIWKLALLIFALAIGAITIWYTEGFLKELRLEEEKKVRNWAEAVRLVQAAPSNDCLTFATDILQQNQTIPIILTNGEGNIIDYRHLEPPKSNPEAWLQKQMEKMASEKEPIIIRYEDDNLTYHYYYSDSLLLKKLRFYPMVLLLVIAIYMTVAYLAFSSSRRAEQNRVWTGMAKETAHQIGTPLSSLMGWVELLRLEGVNPKALEEMETDISRLGTITERFSKIGSMPVIKPAAVLPEIEKTASYLRNRLSKKIELTVKSEVSPSLQIPLNPQLFGWVIENLIRNAADATSGAGKISIHITEETPWLKISVSDTGRGIPASQVRAIFRPGFTTKQRGWGLGLSLAHRIIRNYHRGKIFVAQSEVGKGTTITILLPLN